MPSTPKPVKAALTSSNLKGLMMASTFFMLGADTNNQWSRVNRKSELAKKLFLKIYSTSQRAVEPPRIWGRNEIGQCRQLDFGRILSFLFCSVTHCRTG